jgi:hypothetical protein
MYQLTVDMLMGRGDVEEFLVKDELVCECFPVKQR